MINPYCKKNAETPKPTLKKMVVGGWTSRKNTICFPDKEVYSIPIMEEFKQVTLKPRFSSKTGARVSHTSSYKKHIGKKNTSDACESSANMRCMSRCAVEEGPTGTSAGLGKWSHTEQST